MREIEISDARIGGANPCYVIAEAGVNHNGSLDMALRLVDAAADAGADAVKFQTYSTERLVSPVAKKADYQVSATGEEGSQFEMLKRLELSPEAHNALVAHAAGRGIVFLSTPFDMQSLDFLIALGVPAIKVGSGDLTNTPLLRVVGASGVPVVLSTGMAVMPEIETAVEALESSGCRQYALLHCVSAYPAKPQDCNLRAIARLAERFQVPAGFSDHTTGIDIAMAAVATGASIVEKHLTLDRTLPGPDHTASIEPDEFRAMVSGIRRIQEALGDGVKTPVREELDIASVARKSLHVIRAVRAGETLSGDNIIPLRPGTGIPPAQLPLLAGRTAARDIPAGAMLGEDMFQ